LRRPWEGSRAERKALGENQLYVETVGKSPKAYLEEVRLDYSVVGLSTALTELKHEQKQTGKRSLTMHIINPSLPVTGHPTSENKAKKINNSRQRKIKDHVSLKGRTQSMKNYTSVNTKNAKLNNFYIVCISTVLW
jgi:hypothetical protein